MSLVLIHSDYQKESPSRPVCDMKKGEISRNNIRLCLDCDNEALSRNPNKEMKRNAGTNYPARGCLLLTYWIIIILFDIGWAISDFFQVIRDSCSEQRRHSPDRRLEHTIGQNRDNTYLYECKI